MSDAILLCTDGSELADAALQRGLAVLAPSDRVVIATVFEPTSQIDVVGTGFAGGVVSPEQAMREDEIRRAAAEEILIRTRDALGLPMAELTALDGAAAGPALVDLAAQLPASVIVIGTRGRGGLRRAVLGSVSDHVVRNAPCPVVVSGTDV
jgi:nucleotide-binding universal stress UspA family protein